MGKYRDPELEDPEFQEQDEYRIRRSKGECTCDLLTPYGHVTCVACNESGLDFDPYQLRAELGLDPVR